MAYVYIIQNNRGRYYIGITKLMPDERLNRHNKGDVYSTKFYKPWKLIYTEKFSTLNDAREKEKKIKSWKGGNAFKKFISKAARSSNGRTSPSGGEYPGSSPGLAALKVKKFGGMK